MKRLLGPIDTLHIIVLTMLAMIFVALIVHHVDHSTTGMRTTHAYHATANAPVSR
jgi:hypothetical protein